MSVITDTVTAGGLFPHYDAALEVGQPGHHASDASTEKQLEAPPQPRDRRLREVMEAAALAAGTVRLLGGAVDIYNRRVDALNERWRTAKAISFGVPSMNCPSGASDAAIKAAAVDHADRLLDAKLELLNELERENQRYRRELDAAIAAATERLAAGPTDGLRELWTVGGLPPLATR